jgi:hypothetical protein
MDTYLNIFNNRIDDLTKISINHRKNDGPGVIFCDFSNKEKMNVYFVPLYKDGSIYNAFPQEYVKYYLDRLEQLPNSFIFFNLYDEKENIHIEYDLDKKSTYSNYIKDK